MSTPLVSLVVPIYNGASFVEDVLVSCLAQQQVSFEVLVVDDGSTDGTRELLQGMEDDRVRVLQHPGGINRGVGHTRRLGLEAARGEYVAFLDGDDACLPGRLQQQVQALEQQADAVLCHSNVDFVGDVSLGNLPAFDQGKEARLYALWDEPEPLARNRICFSSVMLRRERALSIPFAYDQSFQLEDWLFVLLAAEQGPFIYLPDPLVAYRWHSAGWTVQQGGKVSAEALARVELISKLLPRIVDPNKLDELLKELSQAIIRLSEQDWPTAAGEDRRRFLWNALQFHSRDELLPLQQRADALQQQLVAAQKRGWLRRLFS